MYAVTAPTYGSDKCRVILRSAEGSNNTSASITSTASAQSSAMMRSRPKLSVCAFPRPPSVRRITITRPGCSAARSRAMSDVRSFDASSTTTTRSRSSGYSIASKWSSVLPMTASSFHAGTTTATRG
jgi:hypothetical protein